MGPYPHSSGVYDVDSIELLRIIQGYNQGVDPAGKEMAQATEFVCATGAEPAALEYDRELHRLEMKVEAGADFIMTQPVYDPHTLDRFLNDIKSLHIPVLVGLCPLASYRNALFLHKNVPGMQIPQSVLTRMEKAEESGNSEKEGVAIARDMLNVVRHRVQGAYIMPPFGRYYLASQVLNP
jgi:homocysteine S-methyltransferase